MRYDLFKIENVTPPLRLHGQPETWAVHVIGERGDGQFAMVPMEFREKDLAEAAVFGINKLMGQVDIWLGPVLGKPIKTLTDKEIADLMK